LFFHLVLFLHFRTSLSLSLSLSPSVPQSSVRSLYKENMNVGWFYLRQELVGHKEKFDDFLESSQDKQKNELTENLRSSKRGRRGMVYQLMQVPVQADA